MKLARRAVTAYMERELDDWRWMKTLTREKILAELAQLKVTPVFKTEPWLHQLVCFYIGLCQPKFLFLLDMGLGKSKIITDIITQLQREKKLKKALIMVPRLSNLDSWQDGLRIHSDLEPWLCNTPDTEEKWERLSQPKGDVTLIDYAGFTLAMCKREMTGKKKYNLVRDDKKMERIRSLYNFIDLDESQKLKNHNNLWFHLLDPLTKSVDYCYANTGTLFGHEVEDLWSQFFLVDRGETFGPNLGLFRAGFFTSSMNPWKGIIYKFKRQEEATLTRMLQHRSLRYDESEVEDLPKRTIHHHNVTMTDEQREHYLLALEGLINADGNLTNLDANWLRMRQITSGYLAWKDNYGDHVLPFKVNPKLDAMEQLVDEMGDSKVIIAYDYTETGKLIVERITAMGLGLVWFYGGTKDKTAARRSFLTDPKCRVMVMNSEAGGTGIDGLQDVARYMILYESPTPPTSRQQLIKRIHRPGQTRRTIIYDLVAQQSLDGGIVARATAGIDFHEHVINGKARKKDFL